MANQRKSKTSVAKRRTKVKDSNPRIRLPEIGIAFMLNGFFSLRPRPKRTPFGIIDCEKDAVILLNKMFNGRRYHLGQSWKA